MELTIVIFRGRINKGVVISNGKKLFVTTDKLEERLKATIEWEINSVYGLDDCKLNWVVI